MVATTGVEQKVILEIIVEGAVDTTKAIMDSLVELQIQEGMLSISISNIRISGKAIMGMLQLKELLSSLEWELKAKNNNQLRNRELQQKGEMFQYLITINSYSIQILNCHLA